MEEIPQNGHWYREDHDQPSSMIHAMLDSWINDENNGMGNGTIKSCFLMVRSKMKQQQGLQ